MAIVASGDWWTLDDNGKLRIFCVGDMPENERPWSGYAAQITALEIADSVTSIGWCAFSGFTGLMAVTIPNSVTSIGMWAFSNCSSLRQISLPKGLTVLEYGLFNCCSSLYRIFIPDSVVNISNEVLYECESLTHIYYGGTPAQWDAVEIFGEGPEDFDAYGYETFLSATIHYNSAGLPFVVSPVFPVEVRYRQFTASFILEIAGVTYTITPPAKTEYHRDELLDYTGLAVTGHLTDGHSFNVADPFEFNPVEGTAVTRTGISISVNVSLYGKPLGSFTLTVAAICDSDVWWELYDDGLLRVFCNGDMPDYDPYEYYLYLDEGLLAEMAPWLIDRWPGTYVTPTGYITKAVISDRVTHIGTYAFYYCQNLSEVVIGKHVVSIGSNAFEGSGIAHITLPDGIAAIGSEAFLNCESLESVYIPNSVTLIENSAFYHCGRLKSVIIPNKLTEIKYYSFRECTSLEEVIIPSSVTTIGFMAFDGCTSLTDVYYAGTSTQWAAISIGNYNSSLTSANIHFNSTGSA